MMESKRLGIFVFYDVSGVVDQYVEVLLDGLLAVLDKLVIVVNGNIIKKSKQKLVKYSHFVFERENVGFDAGGYKDALLDYLVHEDWKQWDEIVLCNDTFYGPIFPWQRIFSKMQQDEETDFWGLSRYPGNDNGNSGSDYPSHIQTYFLVCKKKMILSPFFWRFWEEMKYPLSRSEATNNFEVRFTTYFIDNGFCGKAYTDVCDCNISLEHGGSPYIYYAYELLKEFQFPVIKRNALSIINFERAKKTLDFADKETEYDVAIIYNHLKRLAIDKSIKSMNPLQLEVFYNTHSRIFIYGCGEYGRNIAAYFKFRHWDFAGFLVSEKQRQEEEVSVFREVEFTHNDGIILALSPKSYQEVYSFIKNDFNDSQLFTIY